MPSSIEEITKEVIELRRPSGLPLSDYCSILISLGPVRKWTVPGTKKSGLGSRLSTKAEP
jgi:hypothetical protein